MSDRHVWLSLGGGGGIGSVKSKVEEMLSLRRHPCPMFQKTRVSGSMKKSLDCVGDLERKRMGKLLWLGLLPTDYQFTLANCHLKTVTLVTQ